MSGRDAQLLVDLASSRELELATVNSTLTALAALTTRPPVPKLLVLTAGATTTKTAVAAGATAGEDQAVTRGTKQALDQAAGISNHRPSSHSPLNKLKVEACSVVFSAV